MSLLNIAEVFGYCIGDHSAEALASRAEKWCPFRQKACNKGRRSDPLGVCSFGDEQIAGAVCPSRFLEGRQIFQDIGRAAFGQGVPLVVAPEMRILNVGEKIIRRVGKVDFLIGCANQAGSVTDFCALEIQAVYFSGQSIVAHFKEFMRTGALPPEAKRRLDYRSSAQKRLMPQLSLKVPVFRRWGKKFFVAVDSLFFQNLPKMKTVESLANSEITWLVYDLRKQGQGYSLVNPTFHFTVWDDVLTALREGRAPTPEEIMQEMMTRKNTLRLVTI